MSGKSPPAVNTTYNLANLQLASEAAKTAYEAWLRGTSPSDDSPRRLMKTGFFSDFRHGNTGLQNAVHFVEQINKATNIKTAESLVTKFLENAATHSSGSQFFHRHSFVSFLLDKLRQLDGLEEILDYQQQCYRNGKYPKSVCDVFKQHIETRQQNIIEFATSYRFSDDESSLDGSASPVKR